METHKLSKEAEKIMKEIDGLEVDNDVKRRTADMIVEQTRMNIKSTMQSILESQSRVTINEEQKNTHRENSRRFNKPNRNKERAIGNQRKRSNRKTRYYERTTRT